MSPSVPFELKLLGPFDARVEGQPIARTRSRKSRWVLALLALRAGREVERSWLAGILWPDSTDERALSALRTTLKDLRRALGTEAWRLQGGPGGTLRLDLSDANFDAASFDQLIAKGHLSEALELYRGELLEGCYEDWTAVERIARADKAIQALEKIAESALAGADNERAESCARRALTMEPFRESALRILMLALSSAGNHAGVEKEFARFRKLLSRELNSEPDAETRALYDKLRSRRSPTPSRPKVTSAPQAYLLPKPLTRLIGRDEELNQVETRIRLNRLVTLTGTGGIGKTRLAIAAAERLAPSFKWGACFVDLSAMTDDSLVPDAVLQALGVRPRPGTDSLNSIRHVIANSDLFLVLDNCEQVIEGCARTAAEMLGANESLRVLATSREPLGLTGEIRWKVPPLTMPSEIESAESGCLTAAVTLFLERAEEACGIFEPDHQDLRQAARICRTLDGIPLALEMAAAHAPTMSLSEVADRLGDRFAFLREGSRAAPDRHRTLEATLDWSYRLLTDEERMLLQRLSVFTGGGSYESAVKVCSGDDLDLGRIPTLLEALMRKSLIERDGGGIGDRFRLLESIREFALRALSESKTEALLRERHARHFAEFANMTAAYILGSGQAACVTRFRADEDNCRAAIRWSLDRAQSACESRDLALATKTATMALDLTGACAKFWHRLGNPKEGIRYIDRALRIAQQIGTLADETDEDGWDTEARIQLERARIGPLRLAGYMEEQQGRFSEALSYLQRALEAAVRHGERFEESAALYGMGLVYHDLGDNRQMKAALDRGLEIGNSLENLYLQSSCHNWLGQLAWTEGDFERSEYHHKLANTLAREDGNEARISGTSIFLARLYVRNGRLGKGIQLAREGLQGNVRSGFMLSFSFGLEVLAQAMVNSGQPRHAAVLLGAADGMRAIIVRNRQAALIDYNRLVAALQRKLGKPGFNALYEEGLALTCDEALALALEDPDKGCNCPLPAVVELETGS